MSIFYILSERTFIRGREVAPPPPLIGDMSLSPKKTSFLSPSQNEHKKFSFEQS